MTVEFIPARWFTHGRISGVDVLVLHSTEGYVGHVDALGRDFRTRPADRKASSHSGVDDHRRIDFVHWSDTAYAAPGANADGDHLEMCAFARWSRAEWLTEHPGLLEQAARWLAHRCEARRIPPVYLTADQLRRDRRGITTHRQVSDAFHLTDHRDPGGGFPMDHVLRRVQALLASWEGHTAPATVRPPFPGVMAQGSHGTAVAAWQRRLHRRWGYALVIDGGFGPRTDRATRAFQSDQDLVRDGIVGRRTWAAAWPT